MLSQGQIIALIFVFLALIGGGIGIWYYTKNKSDLDNEKSTETNTPESNPTETNNPESNPTESNTDNLNGKYLFVKGQTVQFNEAQNFCELPNKMIEDSQAPLLNKNFTDDEDRTNNWGNPIWTNSGNRLLWDINQKKYRLINKEYPWPFTPSYALPACIGTKLQPRVAYVKLGDSSKMDWN